MKQNPLDELHFAEVEVPARSERWAGAGEARLKTRNGARLFRPLELRLLSEHLDGLYVVEVFVGCHPCLKLGETAPIWAVSFGEKAVDFPPFPTVAPGIEVEIVVRNTTDKPIRVAAKFRGHAMPVAELRPN
jgi:hypothetical protein